MVSISEHPIAVRSSSRDVVMLVWPDQAARRSYLERVGIPRLWLVEPGIDPPIGESCLEDWLRLPADDADVRARLASLASRAEHHPSVPTLDTHGRLVHHDVVVHLSPVERELAALLIERFDNAVSNEDLIRSARLEGNESSLRVHVSRLRHRLARLGLSITSIYGYGYVMRLEA
jgi:DNA-binding response OmpR family regulator